ncbi:SseB family protein [Shimia ponticola]|uniref:SseB family protein n=1 Tax=Shimia ponticola TaxID=2582893 RepID=UPI0011BEE630|nr:SseB family protein [Shimia ponticola]
MTPLDTAHAAMEAAPEDDAARLRFYERLADAELFLLLGKEATAESIEPNVFRTDDGDFVLVFDLEERLAEFVGDQAPYAALSGRALIHMLQGQNLGLGVNLEVAPSAYLMDAQAVDWLAGTLSEAPQEAQARPKVIERPGGLPELLLSALDAKLALMGAAARTAYLALVTYEDGSKGHMLAFIDAAPGAERALSQAANEALTFSGIDAGQLDVAFFAASDGVSAKLSKVGLRFDLPEPTAPAATGPSAPGMNPDKPPKLR